MSGTADPLSPEFDVTVDGEVYTFRKPGIRYRIELGYASADVRRRAFPSAGGVLPSDFGIDAEAANFARACAILELYLMRSDQSWPLSTAADGKPKVDFDKFPPEREATIWQLSAEFEREVARFRTRGNTNQPPAGEQAVGGVANSG